MADLTFGQDDISATKSGILPKVTPTPEEPDVSFGHGDISAAGRESLPPGIEDAPWHSLITGAGRTEFPDAPELGTSGPDVSAFSKEGMRMAGAYAMSAEPRQVADVALKTLPGAKEKKDKHGNLMISWRGKDYYVNKPGVSEADLFALTAQIAAFGPSSKLAKGKSLLKDVARVAAGSGLTSAGLDLGAEALGADEGVDWTRAGVTAVTAGGAEIISPLARRAWLFFKGKPKLFDSSTGALTDKGRKMAEASGFDPDKMGAELSRIFADEAADATGAAGRVRGKEFGVPMTRGQATGEFNQIAREEATRHGAYGSKAGDIMRSFDEEQQLAMQGARGRVQSRLGGGETRLARPQQAGEFVGPGLAQRAQAAKEGVDAAYEAARQYEARLSADGVRGLTRRVSEGLSDYGIDPQLHPATVKVLRSLGRLERSTRKRAKVDQRVTAVSLKRFETERRKIGKAIDAASTNADRSASITIKNNFDDWLDEGIDNALFEGDDMALAALKKARETNTFYRKMFGSPASKDRVDKVIQNIIGQERTPEQVANYIFGRGQLGKLDASVDIVNRIKTIAGEGSEEFMALREAAWLKLSKEVGQDVFSPAMFRKRLNTVLEENRSLLESLYKPDEIAMMERFRDEVMRTVPPKGATNPSKTSYTLARLAREWMGRIGTMMTFSGSPLGGATFFTIKRAPEVLGAARARTAVSPVPRPRLSAPLFTATAAAGARVGEDEMGEAAGQAIEGALD